MGSVRTLLKLVLLMVTTALSSSIYAETKNTAKWTLTVPSDDEYDWLQLESGELLKGELENLYEGEVSFDSDALGLLSIDIDDIEILRTSHRFSLRFLNGEIIHGYLQVKDGQVLIKGKEASQQREMDKLISINPRTESEIDRWEFTVGLGANISRGNTDQLELNSSFDAKRQTASSRFVMNYNGITSSSAQVRTSENIRSNAYLDIFRRNNMFIRPISVDYYRDPFQNIDRRISLSASLGYQVIDKSEMEWHMTLGPAYQVTVFDDVLPGASESEHSPATSFSSYFETELTDTVDFIVDYKLQWAKQAAGGISQHTVTTFKTELTDFLDFNVSLFWDRLQNPQVDSEGQQRQKDDYRMTFGVEADF